MTKIIGVVLATVLLGACGAEDPAVTGQQRSPQTEGPQEVPVTAVDYAFEGMVGEFTVE